MKNWQDLLEDLSQKGLNVLQIHQKEFIKYQVYPKSVREYGGGWLFLAKENMDTKLIVSRESGAFEKFVGETEKIGGFIIKICSLCRENGNILRQLFPWTAPRAAGKEKSSMGLGDRLGLASPGHIRSIEKWDVFPVLAQQSIRELNLTGRDYLDVLNAASWAVFREGYTEGFGADGDHLKSERDVKLALDLGFSMITLDCSEYIDNFISDLNPGKLDQKYNSLPGDIRSTIEKIYLNKEFVLKTGYKIFYDFKELKRIILIYNQALDFAQKIYENLIKNALRSIDFEISIDEVITPTSPLDHYFIASELKRRGIKITSLAPRFPGEFQKGIDYIGDIEKFAAEFKVHATIADEFGYKISIHSGSDKFSVFPIIGNYTLGRFHLKTAGTNWLEAVRVIAMVNPGLYRKMHNYALENIHEARKYYHVTLNVNKIPHIEELKDEELPGLMDKNDSRQLLHICYGIILQYKDDSGEYIFRDEIYKTLITNEELYAERLREHIGNHLKSLYSNLT